jgi:NADH-quinone oxidoreductase subunit N
MTQADIITILPLIIVVAWAVILMLVDLWIPKQRKGITAVLAAAGLAVALGFVLRQSGSVLTAANGMLVVDGFSSTMNMIFLVSGLAAIALAYDYLQRMGIERGEYYILLMFSISGMMLMAGAYDLIVVFLALELLSIPLYILAGFARPRPDSEESSLKYFLLGAFASGFVLYGTALVYGATAHTDFLSISQSLVDGKANPYLLLAGAALILVGFGFKVAAVPFHHWAPDVYQGAPSPVTGFMSVAVKAAGFAALLRVFITAFGGLAVDLTPILYTLAALTMIGGNVLAVAQTNIKRLLAYSSIANAGYLLMAFVPFGNGAVLSDSVSSALFFLVGYGLTSIGAWAVVVAVEQADSASRPVEEGKGLELNNFAGLARKYPWLALAMLICMLSFTGVPLTLGFWGKFYLFRTAVLGGYSSLALIGLVTSVISAYYYLRVVVVMYMRPGEPQAADDIWVRFTAVVAALAVLVFGFIPGPLLEMAAHAILRSDHDTKRKRRRG